MITGNARRRAWLLLLIAASLLVTACSGRQDVAAYMEEAHAILERWDDAFEVAASTSRVSLSPAIKDLQAVRRDFDDLEPPEPCVKFHASVLGAMNYAIDGFIAFMADEPDDEVNNKFVLSNRRLDAAMRQMDEIIKEYGR
jgi:hypothetical protein